MECLIVKNNHYQGRLNAMKKKSIKRHNRKSVSYKITNEHVKYTLTLLKDISEYVLESI